MRRTAAASRASEPATIDVEVTFPNQSTEVFALPGASSVNDLKVR